MTPVILPFVEATPDILQEQIAKKTLRLEVGKSYFNEAGEIRRIVKFDTEYDELGGYNFYDHMDWTYTKEGIYDIHDSLVGYTRNDLLEEVTYD